jgi:multicomponent Na+:H+ antiporter subunit E
MNALRLRGMLALAITLFAFWLLLSGIYTPFLVLAGLGASIAVAALAQRMELLDREGHPIHLALAALTYWPWLLKEIMKSGWQVTRIIIDPRLPVSPTLVRFRPSQKSTVALAAHANSITLTPGTITVEADHEEFLVHALTREGAAAVVDSEMDRRVSRLDASA